MTASEVETKTPGPALPRVPGRRTARRPRLGPRPSPGEPAPLSHAQTSLWFAQQTASHEGMLNDPIALRLRGVLDLTALRTALLAVLDRHEVLRTTYETVDGVPMQRVLSGPPVSFQVLDRSGASDTKCAAEVLREAARGLDIRSGRVLRALVVRLGPQDHVLLLVLHHIVTDAQSTTVLLTDLSAIYRALTGGAPAQLPALPVQYPDFACWQREALNEDSIGKLLAHWREVLDGAPHHLSLRPDHPRPVRRSSPGRVHLAPLPADLAERFLRTSQSEGVSPFMLGLAAFRTLLWRLTGQRDLLIGSPLTARMRAGTENLVGCFLSMMVLRGVLDDGTTVRELINAERASTLDALAHHELPLERLVLELCRHRDGEPPLFQVTFSFETEEPLPADLFGLSSETFEFGGTASQYDLMLKVVRHEDRVVCQWAYDDELYDEPSVIEFARRYERLLDTMTADPDAALRTLPSWERRTAPERDALAELTAALVWETEDEPLQPRTTSERLVADLWARLLGTAGRAEQEFFELGGHSLSVAQLASLLEEETGVRIPVAGLFEHRTVAAQAELVDGRLRDLLRAVDDPAAERALTELG